MTLGKAGRGCCESQSWGLSTVCMSPPSRSLWAPRPAVLPIFHLLRNHLHLLTRLQEPPLPGTSGAGARLTVLPASDLVPRAAEPRAGGSSPRDPTGRAPTEGRTGGFAVTGSSPLAGAVEREVRSLVVQRAIPVGRPPTASVPRPSPVLAEAALNQGRPYLKSNLQTFLFAKCVCDRTRPVPFASCLPARRSPHAGQAKGRRASTSARCGPSSG